jgi:hypothetical protein
MQWYAGSPQYGNFYAATSITLGNRRKTPFWHAPWLNGRKPIEIAPLVFHVSTRNNWKVSHALHEHAWVAKIDLGRVYSMEHLYQFVEIWCLIDSIHLREDVYDDTVWRLTPNGEYSVMSSYEVQFLGSISSAMNTY